MTCSIPAQQAYNQEVPKADAVMAATDLDALTRKRVDFESRINAIEKSNDVAALGTPEEQRTWARLKRIEDFLAMHPDDPDLQEMREKLRMIKGVMYWRLSESFKARLWNERRSVKELEASLLETQKRAVQVKQARTGMPTNTGAFATRVQTMRARMDELQERLSALAEKQNRYTCRTSRWRSSGARSSASRPIRFRRDSSSRRSTTRPRTSKPANEKPADEAAEPRRAGTRGTFGRPRRRSRVLVCAALAPSCAAAADKQPQTIKDLEGQQVDISPQPPQGVDNNKTMNSYKRFLDLNAGDAALREEAMRRLGDLNLESSESERIEHELATNEGLRATEAIHLYTALLKTYPKYERNDSVLYQLARAYELNAQPDKALASLDRLVASYPKSRYIDEAQFRRGEILFADKSYPAAQAAYDAVIKVGSDLAVLQPEPLQARLVAVQAGRDRAQPRFVRARARLGAGRRRAIRRR